MNEVVEARLRIFDTAPSGHLAYAVPDHICFPLAAVGEVLVVKDAPRTFPVEGEWYLMQWITPPHHEWERHRVGQTIGIPKEVKDNRWAYYPPCRSYGDVQYCGDGLFSFEQMTDYIRGPVVGIYRPG